MSKGRASSPVSPLIDSGTARAGKSSAEFVVERVGCQAFDMLPDERQFVLDSERFDVFLQMLDDSPAPTPELQALLRRVPAWKK